MADSIQNIDKKCIFRETFNNEQSVRKNGGNFTGSLTFGIDGLTNSIANTGYYNLRRISGPVTIRVKFYATGANSSKQIFDGRRAGSLVGPTIYFSASNTIDATNNTTLYKDGQASAAFGWVQNVMYDVCITSTNTIYQISLFNSFAMNAGSNSCITLCEIYQGILTAQEIKNLYENKTYKKLSNHVEQLGPELIDQSSWYTLAYWNGAAPGANWSQVGSTLSSDGTSGSLRKNTIWSAGKRYKIVVTATRTAGTFSFTDGGGSTPTIGLTGTYTFYFNVASSNMYITSSNFAGTITALSIKEVSVNNLNCILDVSAQDGTIRNRYTDAICGGELVINGGFDTDTDWTKSNSSWTINGGTANFDDINTGVYITPIVAVPITLNKKYNIKFTINSIGSANWGIFGNGGASIFAEFPGYVTYVPGTYSLFLTATATSTTFTIYANTAGSTFSIDNFSIKEIVPSITNTNTSLIKAFDTTLMFFNATTSKVDCGNYDYLIGDKTFVAWFNMKSIGENSLGTLIDNGRFRVSCISPNRIVITSNNSNLAYSATSFLKFNSTYFIVITRNSLGLTNCYINGVLSGSADQGSGAPLTGITNITIGNSSAGDRTLDGWIDRPRIYNGILTTAEISELYTSEKYKYGL